MVRGYTGLSKGKKLAVAAFAIVSILLLPAIAGLVMMWFFPVA